MPNFTIKLEVDIYQFPETCFDVLEEDTRITIGDLHGNAIKLMHMLVRQDVAKNINRDEYSQLVDIYLKKSLNKDDIANFKKILDKIQFKKDTSH